MLKKLYVKLRKSIWLTPTIYSLIAILLSTLVILLDTRTIGNIQNKLPQYLFTDIELAKIILSTIATAILAMITFTFSTMMIVLTMYSSQFSPRILPNFLTDHKATVVLGVFMGTFIYSIFSLFFMRETIEVDMVISAAVGIILVILCLAFFTFFIYHVTTSIQVENLIEKLYKEAIKNIDDYNDNFRQKHFSHISSWQKDETSNSLDVISSSNGYIQMIDYEKLLEEALDYNGVIKIRAKVGSFVTEGQCLATIYREKSFPNDEKGVRIRDKFTIGNDRSTIQDIEFSIEKLVDIALRAISPGINDPNTARECINAIGLVLGKISRCTGEMIAVEDKKDKIRLIMKGINFKEILYFTFYQIRHYGHEDISIILNSIDALIIAAHKSPQENKNIIWDFHRYIIDTEENTDFQEMDMVCLQKQINRLKEACCKE